MKYKLPSVTGAFSLTIMLVLAISVNADEGAKPLSGNDLIAAAAANLARLPALEAKLRQLLPSDLCATPMKIDIARHIYRPHTRGPDDYSQGHVYRE